jgi:hypothetical protein
MERLVLFLPLSLALRGRRRLAAFACILLRRRWKERVSRSGLV